MLLVYAVALHIFYTFTFCCFEGKGKDEKGKGQTWRWWISFSACRAVSAPWFVRPRRTGATDLSFWSDYAQSQVPSFAAHAHR